MPRPPWLRRLPSGVWSALTWCAAGLFALLLFVTTTYRAGPLGLRPHPPVTLDIAVRAGVAVVLAVAIGWARRWPLPVFGALLAESCAVATLGMRTWPFFLVLATLVGYLAATRPRRTALAAAGAELAVWVGQWAALNQGQETVSDLLSMLSALAAAIAIAWLIGNSIRQQRDYGEALRSHALTAERLRIARELHDMVAHSMGVIAFQAGAAGLVLDTQPANARKALGAIETTSRETLAGLRRMLVSLRRADEDLSGAAVAVGLEALDRLAETTSDAGVRVQVHREGRARPLPPEIDVAAFRIIQESVTNTVRHSGARRCQVCVTYGDEELAIEITDDGQGAGRSSAGSGFGIPGMRERVALLGGRFSAGSRPEGGFRVTAELPV
ncbi:MULTISPECIES: sensor histidine kinase [Kitasatospora]|uniref:sensor histidine kinase n=1 Tax=Kitasatospora TaxID=2063 RepID=UPI000C70D352|nr:sensor histidine kinase [Kitasatospora sp. GP30]MDH6144906.1 signal transduction histidine kinase [Kitasatospora sp. GP30]